MRDWHKILLIIAGPIIIWLALAFFVAPALFPPLFYAEYNKARRSLEKIPGVEIIDEWQHHDLSLEDCGFIVRVGDSEPVQIDFYDNEDWKTRFKRLDGVTMSRPYNPATNNYESVRLNAQSLEQAGIQLNSLADVLQNIQKVLDLTRSLPHSTLDDVPGGEWCTVYYDLERYKSVQPVEDAEAGGRR